MDNQTVSVDMTAMCLSGAGSVQKYKCKSSSGSGSRIRIFEKIYD